MLKSSKGIIYILICVLLIISLSGVSYYGYKTFYIEKEIAEPSEYKHHIVLIAEEIDNEYWRLVEEGAKKAAAENDIYLEYVGPLKADNDQLLKLFDRMISVKVDGIIIQGVEGAEFSELVFKGTERHIPIITIDTDVKDSVRKAYVGTDNFYAGQLVGEAMIKNTVGKQFVGIVTGRYDSINQQERMAGFEEAIKLVERIQIVGSQESNITQIGAAQATYTLLKEHPSITALVGLSALDGLGIVEGLNEIAPFKDVYITAFDVLPRTLSLIRNGEIDVTIAQYPKEMGYEAMKLMMKLQKQDILDNEVYTRTQIVEKQDVDRLRQGEFN